jgi:hypothetical protein
LKDNDDHAWNDKAYNHWQIRHAHEQNKQELQNHIAGPWCRKTLIHPSAAKIKKKKDKPWRPGSINKEKQGYSSKGQSTLPLAIALHASKASGGIWKEPEGKKTN